MYDIVLARGRRARLSVCVLRIELRSKDSAAGKNGSGSPRHLISLGESAGVVLGGLAAITLPGPIRDHLAPDMILAGRVEHGRRFTPAGDYTETGAFIIRGTDPIGERRRLNSSGQDQARTPRRDSRNTTGPSTRIVASCAQAPKHGGPSARRPFLEQPRRASLLFQQIPTHADGIAAPGPSKTQKLKTGMKLARCARA